MINSKEDLLFYLEADRLSAKIDHKKPYFLGDEVWKFQIILRKVEYYINCASGIIDKLILKYYWYRYHNLSIKLGFSIPPNTFGPGLSIAHYGTLRVNGKVTVGENCRIHVNVSLASATEGKTGGPVIGNNVYIAPGVKMFGDIVIADDIAIGANAVVNKSFLEPGITIAGVPARKVNQRGAFGFITRGTDLLRNIDKG